MILPPGRRVKSSVSSSSSLHHHTPISECLLRCCLSTLSFCFVFARQKRKRFLKAKESSLLCALCLSLLGPKRRERAVRFCYKNERRKALLLLELSFYKACDKEEQHTRERERFVFFWGKQQWEKKQMNFSSSKKKSIKKEEEKRRIFSSSRFSLFFDSDKSTTALLRLVFSAK